MSKHNRIPRPRQLFPELSAFLIEGKRTNLRLLRNLRRAIGRIPIWIAGSLAGVVGIMLAISLFFIHEPALQAAATPDLEPQPTPVIFRASPKSQIQVSVAGTHLEEIWDEENVVVQTSEVGPVPDVDPRQLRDLWNRSIYRESPANSFLSYLSHALNRPNTWTKLLASSVVPVEFAPASKRDMGLLVDKPAMLQGVPNQSLTYEIVVRNISPVNIEDISIREKISEFLRVTDVSPPAAIADGELAWNFQEFAPGAEQVLRVTLVPESTGDIETITRIMPTSRVSASVQVHPLIPIAPPTKPVEDVLPILPEETPRVQVDPGAPKLKLTSTEVKPLKQGDTLSMIFTVSNIGTAAAEDVQLFVRLSGQFEHRYGEFVRHQMGALQPGQSRRALLQATARDPGEAHVDASLTMQGTEKEARELKIPIQSGPLRPNREQLSSTPSTSTPSIAQRPVEDPNFRWVAREP